MHSGFKTLVLPLPSREKNLILLTDKYDVICIRLMLPITVFKCCSVVGHFAQFNQNYFSVKFYSKKFKYISSYNIVLRDPTCRVKRQRCVRDVLSKLLRQALLLNPFPDFTSDRGVVKCSLQSLPIRLSPAVHQTGRCNSNASS